MSRIKRTGFIPVLALIAGLLIGVTVSSRSQPEAKAAKAPAAPYTPLLSQAGFDPANPSSVYTENPDSITLLRMMRTFTEDNIGAFKTQFPSFAELSKAQQEGLLDDLGNPSICGIVVTGAD
jgi:hypothetical protein